MLFRKKSTLAAYAAAALLVVSCGTDFKNITSENMQNAILEMADNYLSAGSCDSAIGVLQPLLIPPYINNDVRMVLASAYGCKGGMNFLTMLNKLKNAAGTDIWSALVAANYTTGTDTKTANLDIASQILRETSGSAANFEASARDQEANTYMVFVQANVIATVISPLGNADRDTGKRTQGLCNGCTVDQQCHVQVAVATMSDALDFVSTGTAIDKMNDALDEVCRDALAGVCPANKDLDVCLGNAGMQAQGQSIIDEIETMWTQL